MLGKAALAQFEVARGVQQQRLGLEVAEDDALGVQVAERHHDVGGVEARRVLVEGAGYVQVAEQVPSCMRNSTGNVRGASGMAWGESMSGTPRRGGAQQAEGLGLGFRIGPPLWGQVA